MESRNPIPVSPTYFALSLERIVFTLNFISFCCEPDVGEDRRGSDELRVWYKEKYKWLRGIHTHQGRMSATRVPENKVEISLYTQCCLWCPRGSALKCNDYSLKHSLSFVSRSFLLCILCRTLLTSTRYFYTLILAHSEPCSSATSDTSTTPATRSIEGCRECIRNCGGPWEERRDRCGEGIVYTSADKKGENAAACKFTLGRDSAETELILSPLLVVRIVLWNYTM